MHTNKKIFSILAILIASIIFFYFSDLKVVESGTILKRDTLTIEKSEIKPIFE